MTSLMNYFQTAAPLLVTLAGVALVLTLAHRFLLGRHRDMGNERRFPRQFFMLGLTVASAVAVAIALPVSDSTRNQVIGLVGILVSGALAFSSTTVLANLMAGVVLRMTQSFHTGDFVRVGDHFGRVAERGIFDVEIQTEQRELVSLSNSYLMANPITVVRSSGAIVSATLSLGYDVHHAKVEPLLLQAATEIGLEDPFSQVLELGNFSITYRVSGLLLEVGNMLSARSRLNRQVLDVLHGAGIEIMSPTFMAQRVVPEGRAVLPEPMSKSAPASEESKAEQVVFDKAEEAGQRAKARRDLKAMQQSLETQMEAADSEEAASLSTALDQLKVQIADLEIESPPG
ncbi:mechanosensitive ion channel domain-containing protein [Rhodoferax sp. PAMC 29310]|uniref:mechanosensitive ion channel domain-containing protein n=1 Tax=Rhodoferax sp. PAMC 29310 TaxID=2822760 RepID=UPI001B339F32|nr:mechanosensitive ion channel domain-containing protein [Rhodoferax sp. PAMC 29310]